MKAFLKKIQQLLKEWRKKRDLLKECKLDAMLYAEAQDVVQVMEYNGNMFLSVNGVPVVGVEDLKTPLVDAIIHARMNYKSWKEEQIWFRKGITHGFTQF